MDFENEPWQLIQKKADITFKLHQRADRESKMMVFTMLVGGLNDKKVTAASSQMGQMQAFHCFDAFGESASFICLSEDQTIAYVANESEFCITTVKLEWQGITLVSAEEMRQVQVDDPCHIALHPSGKYIFTASYQCGSIQVLPLDEDQVAQDPE